MKKPALLLFCVVAMIAAGITGCGNSAPPVSTKADHDALKGRQATPEEMAAMMKAQSQSRAAQPQQPK